MIPKGLERYLELIAEDEGLVDNIAGGYRVLIDTAEIAAVEAAQRRRLHSDGMPAAWASVGVVYEDQYILVLRDAVEFPNGQRGTYIRVLSRSGGVVILPLLDNRVVLLNRYRHATRRWHLELPRGFAEGATPSVHDARREVAEEIGTRVHDIKRLGTIHSDTGLTNNAVVAFIAYVGPIGTPDALEAVRSIDLLTPAELTQRIADGTITDAYTLATHALAHSAGLWGPSTDAEE